MSDTFALMKSCEAVSAHRAECFVTIDGARYTMCFAKNFEGKATVNSKEVPRLGNIVVGHKPVTITLAFSMTIYKVTDIFDRVIQNFIKTGVMPTFTIQTTNYDQAAAGLGRSTKIYNDCSLDGDVLLSMFDAEGDFIEQAIEGYCDGFEAPEQFHNPSYM